MYITCYKQDSIEESFIMIVLSAQNIVKSFGINTVLKDVSLTIQQGDRMGLVGVNGCGKSTLMRIIAGLDSPDGGEIAMVKGTRIGYLAQQDMVALRATMRLGWEIPNPVSSYRETLDDYSPFAVYLPPA
jgi:ATPase subunit of ABC transporter with duplicated ATPase domains